MIFCSPTPVLLLVGSTCLLPPPCFSIFAAVTGGKGRRVRSLRSSMATQKALQQPLPDSPPGDKGLCFEFEMFPMNSYFEGLVLDWQYFLWDSLEVGPSCRQKVPWGWPLEVTAWCLVPGFCLPLLLPDGK